MLNSKDYRRLVSLAQAQATRHEKRGALEDKGLADYYNGLAERLSVCAYGQAATEERAKAMGVMRDDS